VSDLQQRVDDLDTQKWWADRETTPLHPQPPQRETRAEPRLHNPYEGCHYAWQLSETIDEFLARLPPATTRASEDVPWIYVCNPYVVRKPKAEAQNQLSKGNEDEGTEEFGCNLPLAQQEAMEILEFLDGEIEMCMSWGGRYSTSVRSADHERYKAVDNILDVAWEHKVRCGKVRREPRGA
jgi:hypothetical protein